MKVLWKDLILRGDYLNIFHYRVNNGKTYEVCSRKVNPNPNQCDAVSIIAFNPTKSKICLISEYRIPIEDRIYSFPAGLCESGEDIPTTATRELREETGLAVESIIDILPPAYQSAGMTDESVATVICTASGLPNSTGSSYDEDIIPAWYSKEEVKSLLDSGCCKFSARCQIFLTMWAKEL